MKIALSVAILAGLLSGCCSVQPKAASQAELSYEDIVKVMEAGWLNNDPLITEASCIYQDGIKLKDQCTTDYSALIAAADAGRRPVPAEFSLTPEQRSNVHMRIYVELYEIAIRRAGQAQLAEKSGCPDRLDPNKSYATTPLKSGKAEISCSIVVDVELPDDVAGFIGKPYPVKD